MWGFPEILAGLAPSLGHAYALRGRVAEGLYLLEGAVAQAMSAKLMFSVSLWLANLSEAYLLAGRRQEAWDTALRAVEVARDCGERGHEARALRQLAEVANHGQSAENSEAERLYREALLVAETLGMKPLVARSLLGLGTVALKQDHREMARRHLTGAIELFRSLGMTSGLEAVETQLQKS